MLVNKQMLDLAKLASTDASRYALNGMLFDKGKVIVSDGKRLVVGEFKVGYNEEDFPDTGLKGGNNFKTIIPAVDCLRIAREIPKQKRNGLPILNHAQISVEKEGEKNVVKVATVPLNSTQKTISTIEPTEGNYPDYEMPFPKEGITTMKIDGKEKVISNTEKVGEIVVNPLLLADMLHHFALSDKFCAVKITMWREKGKKGKPTTLPLSFLSSTQEQGTVRGLLMPLTVSIDEPVADKPTATDEPAPVIDKSEPEKKGEGDA